MKRQRHKKRQPARVQDSQPSDYPSAGAFLAAAAILLAAAAGFFWLASNLVRIVFQGGICYKRSGCRYWATHTWSLSVEVVALLLVLLILGFIVVGCLLFLAGTEDEEAK
jgi:peptidoglycan/LPS O-acetylase OafA/YrhL